MTTVTTSYEIPLEPAAQTFQIALAGYTYAVTMWWSTATACWNISIADPNGAAILDSIPLVTGVDLLGPYAYLGFGGQLVVQTDHNPDAVPTFENLGTTGHVYFVVTTTIKAPPPNYTNIYFGLPDTSGITGGGGGGRETIGAPPPRSISG
jgi:hypothetical protein